MKKTLALFLVLTMVIALLPAHMVMASEVASPVVVQQMPSFVAFTTPTAVSPGAIRITSTNVDATEDTNFNAPVNVNLHIGLTELARESDFTVAHFEWRRPNAVNDRNWGGGSVNRSAFGNAPGFDTNLPTLRIDGGLSQAQRGGRWELRVTLVDADGNELFQDDLFVTYLTVRGGGESSQGGGGNNQGQNNNNQGQNNNNQGDDDDDDDDDVIISRPPTVVINVNVSTTVVINTINQAVINNTRPNVVFVLSPGQGGVSISGNDVQTLINAGGSITIVHYHKTINISTRQMMSWNITAESEITIVIESVHRPSFDRKFNNKRNKPSKAPTVEILHQMLLSVLVEVTVRIDGVAVIADDSEATIAMDVSHLNLTDEEKQHLVAIFFYLEDPDDPDSMSYKIVEGFFDEDGYFHVPFLGDGWIGFFLGDYPVNQLIALFVPTFTLNQWTLTLSPDGGSPIPLPFVNPTTGENMLSLRVITYALGGSIEWVAETNTAIVINNNVSTSISMHSQLPGGFGMPIIVENRSFLPESFLSVLFNVNFNWSVTTGNLYVQVPDEDAPEEAPTNNSRNNNEDDDDQGEDEQ
ncbi:MAG: copper amine oxidase N-terminal domain-containing protein [Defluviitaleaceae bacterium]|nr:copper amine oxidase N-terminal domain-containing protein [Defluviitaleaceae bacterium]